MQSTTLFYVHTESLVSQPISRVLSWTVIHLGQASPLASSNLPVSNAGDASWKPIWSCSEWGLPCHCCYQQCGVLLPHPFTLTQYGRFAFCGTFPGVTPAGYYPAPCFRGARTFLYLLYPEIAIIQLSGTNIYSLFKKNAN